MNIRKLGVATLFAGAVVAASVAAAFAAAPEAADAVYVAHLKPLNVKASGLEASGEMRFTVRGDRLNIKISVHGVPPNIEHWQHFHGFPDGHAAACPTAADDVNGDGYIDIHETEPVMGTTMVPFNDDPVAMNVPTDTYPHADAQGGFEYEKTVSLKALQASFGQKFGGGTIDLDHRVVQVHGVFDKPALAASVASLGTIPSRVTLPLACGKIERVQ
jgi:hypothetical protein